MADSRIRDARIAGIVTCVPARRFDNVADTTGFTAEEVKKVVAMAGVAARRMAGPETCSSDLCVPAAQRLLQGLGWERDSIDALIMVTQSPDYFLPSTACVLHHRLELADRCAAFDVGLGCSGYPYALWLAAMMVHGGQRRVLILHGETPSRFAEESDRSVALLFGDAGSATAVEPAGASDAAQEWTFVLQTDGGGWRDMLIAAGGFRKRFSPDSGDYFVKMNGAGIFNFTIKRVPPLVEQTLACSGRSKEDVDYYIFHQSNQFIMRHLASKIGLPGAKVPIILKEFGNVGGPSIPLAMTQGGLTRPVDRPLLLMLLGYGVGLSWGSALVPLDPAALLAHVELEEGRKEAPP